MHSVVSLPRASSAAGSFATLGRRLADRGLIHPVFAAGGVAALGQLLAGGVVWPPVAVAFLVTYASYLIDSASERSATGSSPRSAHLAGRPRATRVLGAAAFAAALVLAAWHVGPGMAAALLLFPAAVGVYCLPVRQRWPRCVKDIPYAKTFWTASFWGAFGVWAVVALGHGDDFGAMATGFTLFAVRDWLNTAFCDVKDLDRDRAAGVRTLASRLGLHRLLPLLALVNGIFAVAWLGLVVTGALPSAAVGLLLTCVWYQAQLWAAARPAADLDWWCDVVADTEWLPWPLYVAFAAALLG